MAYTAQIKAAAEKYDIPDRLLTAQLSQESGFNPDAISPAGAEGIAQLMPQTASSLGVSDPFNANASIMAAAKYDSENFSRFGDWTQALEAYNEGPTATANGVAYPQAVSYAQAIESKAGMTSDDTGASWYRKKDGTLVMNLGGSGGGNGSTGDTTSTGGSGGSSTTGSGKSSCPDNDKPILSIMGYALITPCGLWDLAIGLIGVILLVAGLRSDVGKTIVETAKSMAE